MRFLWFLLLPLMYSCSKKQTVPADNSLNDPAPTTNFTIAQLIKQIPQAGAKSDLNDWVISGIVTADDRSGNFYKQIILDDGTAAIAVLLDAYNLYCDFPVGRRLYIRSKGLSLCYYNKSPQLGYMQQGSVSAMPYLLFDQFIIKGPTGNTVNPITVLAAEAATYREELLDKLITIQGIQITDTQANACFALAPEQASATDIRLEDCNGAKLTLRTSGYSSFRANKVPTGNGSITAIYSTYNNSPQLLLRDPAEMQCSGARCH